MTTPSSQPKRRRAAIILAAGKSTRMKSDRSKVLHELAGRPLLGWVHDLAVSMGCERIVCVVGAANEDVRDEAETLGMDIAVQEPQLGTAHAVQCAETSLSDFEGDVVVLYADTPMVRKATMDSLLLTLDTCDVAVLGFESDEPGSYGRLVEVGDKLEAIIEAKDASPEQLSITLCNSGVLASDSSKLFDAIRRVGNDNAKGEYYLTDVVALMRDAGDEAKTVRGDESEMLGVNSREDLAQAHKAFQANMRRLMLDDGVTLRDPDSVYFSYDTQIERDAVIGENVVFGPGAIVRSKAVIHPFSHIEGASVGEGASIGPFARLRKGADIGRDAKIGNFVEVKNTSMGQGAKASHLTYLGDATVGRDANIGAGTVTCNYDGFQKHRTSVGAGAFIGTHTALVAPVEVGAGAFTATGTVVTKDVPEDALAIARTEQTNKEGWAKRFRTAMRKRLSPEQG